jgi:hypothetical protein
MEERSKYQNRIELLQGTLDMLSQYTQLVSSCTGLSAQIRSQSSQQVSCSHLPVLSPRSSPLAARRLPIR